jgi:hypothetical protein
LHLDLGRRDVWNCEMGSAAMATRPTITIRIEMTIATMGRLTKNLAMMPLKRVPEEVGN